MKRFHRCASAAGSVLFLAVLCSALLVSGCARRTPLADAASSGVDVWVRMRTTEGEPVTGTLVSLDAGTMVLETRRVLSGEVRVRDRGGKPALYDGADRLPGVVVDVESDEAGRVAVLRRTFRALEVESATFHEGAGQRSLAQILSHVIGPVVGGTLALIL